ncbi:MAG: TolC family protein [Pirellulaceae bacterium]
MDRSPSLCRFCTPCLLVIALLHSGCSHSLGSKSRNNNDTQTLSAMANVKLQKPLNVTQPKPGYGDVAVAEPFSARREAEKEFWDVTLEEAIQMGLTNADILRDLGGQVVHSPESIPSRYQIATTSSDPRFGVQAALSAFDAQLSNRLFFQNNDRVFNNSIAGLGVNEFQQDLFGYETGISKRTATGATFSVSHRTDYDANNSTTNTFPNAWNVQLNATARVPLLRGGGTTFNRIAGPDAQPGFFLAQGVLLARVNEDISAADFEKGVIKLVSDIETAYWELYFAYRNIDIVGEARDSTRQVLKEVSAAVEAGSDEGFRQLATEMQVHALDEQYHNAMAGTTVAGQSVGVYKGERTLRWMMGLPPTDGRLIRPSDHPTEAEVTFDWDSAAQDAIKNRVELRRQQWQIKKYQLEAIAAKNFILPQLDLYSTYRVRGFGDDLAGSDDGRFASAWRNLGTFDYQEVEGGIEFAMPVGHRQGWAAVRHASLQQARALAVLKHQSERVLSELSDAVAEVDRADVAIEINYRRLTSAEAYMESIELAWENDGLVSVETRLDAINQVALARTLFHRAVVDQAIAIRNVHLAKGSLLCVNGVQLAEEHWPSGAYQRSTSAAGNWVKHDPHCPKTVTPCPLANGEIDQQTKMLESQPFVPSVPEPATH